MVTVTSDTLVDCDESQVSFENRCKILASAVTISTVMTKSNAQQVGNGSTKPTKIDWQAALAQHGRWLRTIAFSRLRDREAVDEVMQEVALAISRQPTAISDNSKIAPWLYRLVTRQVLLFRRRCGRQRKLLQGFAERMPERTASTVDADPLDWLLADERRQMIRVAVERLPQHDATVLLLKYTENWSYAQIAEHLGVSQSAVESRLHRARARLRQELLALQVVEV